MFDFKKVLEKIKSLDNNKISCKKIYTGIDLNTINNTEIGDFGVNCTNKPWDSSSGGYLVTITMSDNYALQMSINASNGDNYQRIKTSGTWQSWVKK